MIITKMLDVNAVHVKPSTLNSEHHKLADYDYGAIFWVPGEGLEVDGLEPELLPIFTKARHNWCEYVMIDKDGAFHADLPTFNEDWP